MIKRNNVFRYFLMILSSALLSIFLLLIFASSVSAKEVETESVKLRAGKENNIAFLAENLFPGDAVTKDFTIKVSHRYPIDVYHQIDVSEGSEKLEEVLKVKIELPEKDLILYEGLMKDMTEPVIHKLAGNEKEVIYRITAYLDTGVGNDYQYKSLTADFRWWYMEEPEEDDDNDNSEDLDVSESTKPADKVESPKTGDHSNLDFYLLISILSSAGLLILRQKKKV